MIHIFSRQNRSAWLCLLLHTLLVNAQSGDGGSADGYSNSNLGAAGTGAEGSSNSSANLSKGAIIAIAVVVGLVVVGGVSLAVLFYLTKKRQWQLRRSIRRTTSKVVRAITPRTPSKMTFSPISPRAPKSSGRFEELSSVADKTKLPASGKSIDDPEKGFTSIETRIDTQNNQGQTARKQNSERLLNTVLKKNATTPQPIQTLNIQTSHFEIDSPKSPLWTRFLGRK